MNVQDLSKTMEIIYIITANTKILFSGELQTFPGVHKIFNYLGPGAIVWIFSKIIPDSQTSLMIEGRLHQISVFFFLTMPFAHRNPSSMIALLFRGLKIQPTTDGRYVFVSGRPFVFLKWYQRDDHRLVISHNRGQSVKWNHCNHWKRYVWSRLRMNVCYDC